MRKLILNLEKEREKIEKTVAFLDVAYKDNIIFDPCNRSHCDLYCNYKKLKSFVPICSELKKFTDDWITKY